MEGIQTTLVDRFELNFGYLKWRILSRTSTEQSGKNEKKNLPTGLQVQLEDMF